MQRLPENPTSILSLSTMPAIAVLLLPGARRVSKEAARRARGDRLGAG
jgi:hypothetical protein